MSATPKSASSFVPSWRQALLLSLLLSSPLSPGGAVALAQGVDRALSQTESQRRQDARSQQRIDRLDDATREALQQYRAAVWESQQLDVYVEQLQTLIDEQAAEVASLEAQIEEIGLTEREIMPLMLRMVDALERFVAMDLPFLQSEREDRVKNLRRTLGDPSVSVADRYQRVIEAYSIESTYGRSVGHERMEIDGQVHDVLRIGRVGLFALSLDGDEALRWDAASEAWQQLPGRYTNRIRTGLRISRDSIAPELLLLPVAVPEPGEGGDVGDRLTEEAAPPEGEAEATSDDNSGEGA